MKTLRTVAAAVGLEGFLVITGTAALAAGTSYLHPAGPWLVSGAVALGTGFAVALRSR